MTRLRLGFAATDCYEQQNQDAESKVQPRPSNEQHVEQHLAQTASGGDLSRSEAMLTTQAHTLDALFHRLIGWGLNHVKEGGNPV